MVKLEDLTPDQLVELQRQLELKQKAESEQKENERKTYKQLVDSTVPDLFKYLENICSMLFDAKEKVFNDCKSLIDLKCKLFRVKDDQQSHTFTTGDGKLSIKLGHRVVDGYDDTVMAGISKIKQCISQLATDERTEVLVNMVTDLMKPDVKGNLKASRVLELQKRVAELGDPEMIDAVKIIQQAYRPVRTCSFIEARYRDDNGVEHNLPLSLSSVPVKQENS